MDLSSIVITDHKFLLTARIFTTAKLQAAIRLSHEKFYL